MAGSAATIASPNWTITPTMSVIKPEAGSAATRAGWKWAISPTVSWADPNTPSPTGMSALKKGECFIFSLKGK